jgi:hypothetical protein
MRGSGGGPGPVKVIKGQYEEPGSRVQRDHAPEPR